MKNLEDLLQITDLWTYLEKTDKKIVLYGMGDGAEKILDVCEKKGIKVSGIFASDEFAKYKKFRGFTVKKYADIKAEYENPVILVSFATRLDSVMNKIYNLCETDELYAPDVPVFGEGLFDSAFFKENFDKFEKVFSLLSDDISKKAYLNIIKYKLTGKINYLKECETSASEAYSTIIKPKKDFAYVDIGAYNGDTIREYLSYAKGASIVTAFEPDVKNYAKLSEYAKTLDVRTNVINAAAWDKDETLTFYSRSGRNSSVITNHPGLKPINVKAVIADNYINAADYINIDAEGSDMKALYGLQKTVKKFAPVISCAVYHRNEDMFSIPLYLAGLYDNFEMYIRHFPYVPAWDTNVYIKNKD
jgi:FkbM family methyltransferase